jgi:hypothetical protein
VRYCSPSEPLARVRRECIHVVYRARIHPVEAIPRRIVRAGFALLAFPALALGATISFNVDRTGSGVVIEASALLDADPATAWRVLTDYERYAEFIPDIRASRVVKRDGTEVIVEQTGDATFGSVHAPVGITYRIDERAPTRIVSHASAGGMPALASTYALTGTVDGVRLDYRGRVSAAVSWSGQAEGSERSVERGFRALADEIERVSASQRRPRRDTRGDEPR